MRTLIATTLFGAALGLSAAAQPPAPDKKPGGKQVVDPKAGERIAPGPLDGAYTIVSGERDGTAIPEAELKGGTFRFALGTAVGKDKDNKEFFAAAFSLDTDKKPWALTLKSVAPQKATDTGSAPAKPGAMSGLAKKDGDTVTFVYARPGGKAPTEFKTKQGQQMYVLRRFSAEPADPNKFEKGP
jgi:uncharacterized protein (TIGR03067 family)